MPIGDKTGPAIVALTYGDVRPDHLLKQAQRIRLTVQAIQTGQRGASSIERSITWPDVSAGAAKVPEGAKTAEATVLQAA
jgi:hypothetical protein